MHDAFVERADTDERERVRDKLCVQENHRSGFSLTVKPARTGTMMLPVAQRRDRRIQLRTRARGAKEAAGYNLVKARLLLRAVVLAVNFIFHHVWQAVRAAMPFHR